jgi:hypothetical protein
MSSGALLPFARKMQRHKGAERRAPQPFQQWGRTSENKLASRNRLFCFNPFGMGRFDFTLAELKKMDMVDYLKELGHDPQRIRGNDYWFLSPLRIEKTASFKVNRRLNVWYDHGIGKGGNLIDFAVAYFNCTVRELLHRLECGQNLSFPPPNNRIQNESANRGEKIQILNTRPIRSAILKDYLTERKIPFEIACGYCVEVDFKLYGKTHTALGFQNNLGGYELRSPFFKGSNAPKSVTYLEGDEEELAVFEGLFSFLSYQTLKKKTSWRSCVPLSGVQPSLLILNSLSFFEKSRCKMESHQKVHLFLDCDEAGMKCAQKALLWSSKYHDQSGFYKRYKDLNEFLVQAHDV